ncbi:MAG: FAD-binding oxidoreductase, partial [Cyclobacteriaceae bacterium]|nr:FAD-binding oxidoreductase [Cyclobacteriaceae bacterium]
MKFVDYILVGQGIAGSVLFSKLQERGKKVVVYNSDPIESSSRVAAGIFNPVTGKKMVKTWIADKLWPVFTEFYQNLEKKSGQRFFYEIPQYRPFLSHQEMVQQANGDAEGYGQFLEKVITTPLLGKSIINPYGGLLIRKTGYIDVGIFLDYVKSLIVEEGYLEEKKINNSDIQIEDDHVIVGQYKSKHLIFCNGWTAENSDFFGWLPFSPVKGEVLHTTNDMGLDLLVNRGVFVLPHHDGLLRIGATYEHKALDFVPTEG